MTDECGRGRIGERLATHLTDEESSNKALPFVLMLHPSARKPSELPLMSRWTAVVPRDVRDLLVGFLCEGQRFLVGDLEEFAGAALVRDARPRAALAYAAGEGRLDVLASL